MQRSLKAIRHGKLVGAFSVLSVFSVLPIQAVFSVSSVDSVGTVMPVEPLNDPNAVSRDKNYGKQHGDQNSNRQQCNQQSVCSFFLLFHIRQIELTKRRNAALPSSVHL